MPSAKSPPSSSNVRASGLAVLLLGCWTLTISAHAAVVIAPEKSVDPRQRVEGSDPRTSARAFVPLREGEPLDYAHWPRDRPLPKPGRESVIVKNPLLRPALYAGMADVHPAERVPPDWYKELSARRATLAKTLASVGRLEAENHQTGINRSGLASVQGTAFVVAKGLLMTNRHVAYNFFNLQTKEFYENQESLLPYEAWIDFGGIRGNAHAHKRFRVTGLVYASPTDEDQDVALLSFDDPNHEAPPPLQLQMELPSEPLENRQVIVCGYPASQDYLMFRVPAVKRVSPGYLTAMLPLGINGRYLLHHDSSTTGGNSGSPLVDLQTGLVFGLHFQGVDDRSRINQNAAEPIWDLLNIPEVRQALGVDKPEEMKLAQAVVQPTRRPALLVDRAGTIFHDLSKVLSPEFEKSVAEDELRRASAAVARVFQVDNGNHSGANAILVAPRLLMLPDVLVDGNAALVANFNQTYDEPAATIYPLRVIARFRRTNYFDAVALAEVLPAEHDPGLNSLPKFLALTPTKLLADDVQVAVIGHHVRDFAAIDEGVLLTVFAGPDFAKRLSPGIVHANTNSEVSTDLAHDATTMAGSMGSPILDLKTGAVLGIHVGAATAGPNLGVSVNALFERNAKLRETIEAWR